MARPVWLPYALVVLLACAVHLASLGFDFVFDDEHLVVNNTFLRQDWSPLTAFRHHFWHGTPFATSYYRPIVTASLAINGRLLGWSPPGFHLVNVLFHAANAALLLALARRLGAGPRSALLAAALFAAHPVAAWPVASVVARVDLLPALFLLLAWWSIAASHSWRAAICCGGLFLTALLCKESAVAFLSVPCLGLRRGAPGTWRPVVTSMAALATYALMKAWAGIPLIPGREVIEATTNPLGALPFPARLWAALELSGRYLQYLLLPARLADPRDYVSGPLPGPLSIGVLLSSTILVLWCLTVGLLWLRRSRAAEPLAFSLASFLPASNLLLPIGSLYAQNFLYLPLLGLAVAAASGFDRPREVATARETSNRRPLVIGVTLVSILALATLREASIWRDARSLFSAWTHRFPRYSLGHSRLGVALLADGRTWAAEKHLREALRLDHRSVEAHYNLGVCLALTARDRFATEEALRETEAALALSPDLVPARVNAGRLHLQLDQAAEAELQARAALRLSPGLPQARLSLAEALFRQDRFSDAAQEFGALALARPDDPAVRSPYVVALLRSGDLGAARAAAEQARLDFPTVAWFDFCLARVEILSGHWDRALDLLQISLDKDIATQDWLTQVEDFESLRGRPRFEALRRSPQPAR